LVLGISALSVYLGTLLGDNTVEISWADNTQLVRGPVDAVIEYHMFSSESSLDVFQRSPGIEWTGENAEFKTYDGRIVSLPTPETGGRALDDALKTQTVDIVPLSLPIVSSILHFSAGVTDIDDGYHLRAAPSSGALAPTEVYLHTPGFEGVDRGIYYYHPLNHHLIWVASGGDVDSTYIYITSIFQRTGKKYKDRAYRYAVADAGHIVENLRLVAGEYGYAAQPLTHFDEGRIQADIGLDGIMEGVIASIRLTDGWTVLPESHWSFLAPPTRTELGVTGIAQHATSLTRFDEKGRTLPPPSISRQGVFDAIQARRSRRRFSDASLALEDLSALLLATHGPGNLLSRSLVIRMVVDRVEGLESGVYRYWPSTHSIVLERSGDFMADAYSTTFSQDAVGEGAVAFVISTDRRTLFADHGARGYRHAYLEAGMKSERILLTAVGLGLSACPVGAFFDDDAAQLIGKDMDEEWVLHFIGLGRP